MLYPAIVSVIALVIVIFLVTYVVPQVATVFTSSQARAAGADGGDARRSAPSCAVRLADARRWRWRAIGAWLLLRRGDAFRERIDAALLTLPLVGRLARGYNAARFAGTLAMLAAAGVPILKALQAAAETLANRAMRADAMDALVQVREGAPLAAALAGKKRFPGLLAMFARLGEQTGQLPRMLEPRGHAAGRRGAAPRDGDGDDPRAAADRRHGRGRDADRAGGAVADHPAQHLGQVALAGVGCQLGTSGVKAGLFPIEPGHVVCLNESNRRGCTGEAMSNDLVPMASRVSTAIPLAQMRSVYRVDDVEKRLGKLPAHEHESLRTTYERMLEKGPERFQVKPSGLPAMEHLYDELPNFTEVLDDVEAPARAVPGQPRRARRSRRCCCSARPASARPISRASRAAAGHRHGLRLDEFA